MFDFEMTYEEWMALSEDKRKELDRNYWRYGRLGNFLFMEMTEEEKKVFEGKESK